MKAPKISFILLSLSLLGGIAYPAISQDDNTTSEHSGEDNGAVKAFEITLQGDPDNRTGEPAHVTISIKNISGRDLLLRNIEITESTVISDSKENKSRCKINQRDEILLRSGLSFEQDCQFYGSQPEENFYLKRIRMSLLASKLKLMIMVDTKQLGTYRYYPSIRIPAQEYSIFIGGVLGAILLAAFVWIERVLRNPVIRANMIKSLLPTALMGLRGGIMAIIALLLGRASHSAGSPITLTVTDFTGGLLVGLFSYPLAAWITSALKIDEILLSPSGHRKSRQKLRGAAINENEQAKNSTQQSASS